MTTMIPVIIIIIIIIIATNIIITLQEFSAILKRSGYEIIIIHIEQT